MGFQCWYAALLVTGFSAHSHVRVHLSLHNEVFYAFLLHKIAYVELKLNVELFIV